MARSQRNGLAFATTLIHRVCEIAGEENLIEDVRASFQERGLVEAIHRHDNDAIFQWLADAISYQGVSDRVARTYIEEHGAIRAEDIRIGLTQPQLCPKLKSYWHFERCGYRKAAKTCSQPRSLPTCPLPRHDLRNGRLNQAAYHLFLFMRDVAGGDFVGWLDRRLERADTGHGRARATRLCRSIVEYKASAETAAGSVIGRPTADHLPNWKLSDPRLEQLGRYHNDNLLIIDDLKTAEGTDKERFQALQQRAHWFSSGGTRGRHAKAMENLSGKADSHLGFRTIILSSYEHPIDKIAERAKSVFDGGDVVRIVDVEASPAGAIMIFDHPLPKVAGKDGNDVAESLLADLRAGARKHHGVVFDAWIRILIDDPDGAKAAIKSSMEEFIKAADLATASAAVRRHARHLALVFGVGDYAIKRKLFPWDLKRFKVDMLKIYATARARLEKTLTLLPMPLTGLTSI